MWLSLISLKAPNKEARFLGGRIGDSENVRFVPSVGSTRRVFIGFCVDIGCRYPIIGM